MPDTTPPIELGELEQARDQLLSTQDVARSAPDQLRDAETVFFSVKRRLKEVIANNELRPLERAGWLLAVEGAEQATDLEASADRIIAKFEKIDNQLRQPGTPVLVYESPTFTTPPGFNFLKATGEGLEVVFTEFNSPRLSVAAEGATWFPSLASANPDLLMAAATESAEVEEMDIDHYVWTGGTVSSHKPEDMCLVVGKEAVTVFLDKLLALQEPEYKQRKAEDDMFEIWKMAKQLGYRLDENSEAVADWLRRRRAASAKKLGKQLVKELCDGYQAERIELDEQAAEMEVTPQMVKDEAIRYHQAVQEALNRI